MRGGCRAGLFFIASYAQFPTWARGALAHLWLTRLLFCGGAGPEVFREQYQKAANGKSFTEELRTGAVSKRKLEEAVNNKFGSRLQLLDAATRQLQTASLSIVGSFCQNGCFKYCSDFSFEVQGRNGCEP